MLEATGQLKLLAWKFSCYVKYHWFTFLLQFLVPIISTYLTARFTQGYAAGASQNITSHHVFGELRTKGFLLTHDEYAKIYYCPISANITSVINLITENISE